ncbi:GNAT family N-acetyltransferase [uncultured Alistipes sp.]|uniref:GNAT family N-acetyltransferase n=1 Tax=uncultured Alistipes sp. TaxID=538949 RepID=UPI0025D21DF6|nr:GNAT family N-acetyltransferase [uncultured Alistipes sp.]
MAVEIREITEISTPVEEALARLMPQLSPSLGAPSHELLQRIVGSGHTVLFAAVSGAQIVGVLTLTWYDVPSGRKAWIEDVVVDTAARGCGAGEALVRAAVGHAARIGAVKLQLTSNPARQAAHALYRKIGFEEVKTAVFVLKTE